MLIEQNEYVKILSSEYQKEGLNKLDNKMKIITNVFGYIAKDSGYISNSSGFDENRCLRIKR